MSIFGQTLRQNILGFADALDSVGTDRQWVLSVMQSHGNELVTLLWRILGNEQDVCDVYQSTFLRLAHLNAGRKPAHVKALAPPKRMALRGIGASTLVHLNEPPLHRQPTAWPPSGGPWSRPSMARSAVRAGT